MFSTCVLFVLHCIAPGDLDSSDSSFLKTSQCCCSGAIGNLFLPLLSTAHPQINSHWKEKVVLAYIFLYKRACCINLCSMGRVGEGVGIGNVY